MQEGSRCQMRPSHSPRIHKIRKARCRVKAKIASTHPQVTKSSNSCTHTRENLVRSAIVRCGAANAKNSLVGWGCPCRGNSVHKGNRCASCLAQTQSKCANIVNKFLLSSKVWQRWGYSILLQSLVHDPELELQFNQRDIQSWFLLTDTCVKTHF